MVRTVPRSLCPLRFLISWKYLPVWVLNICPAARVGLSLRYDFYFRYVSHQWIPYSVLVCPECYWCYFLGVRRRSSRDWLRVRGRLLWLVGQVLTIAYVRCTSPSEATGNGRRHEGIFPSVFLVVSSVLQSIPWVIYISTDCVEK